eukprot:CAMPEP_0181320130 /NCGR_PEP_ID=MMETSP1101-20121128/17953_1 /TAXON_ID=46948 /ORGANISM="Rhodomonas abbreviata, Strain Caron Lab Isolate" /LENGTH=174 /DNA_ID=CAMNT_0023427801 /DNA_START=99 /DNA_END=623 /DNA_ORIENTATION=+
MKRCTRCKVVYYCGRTCQAAHWATHKTQCNSSCQAMNGGGEADGSSGEEVQSQVPKEPLYSGIRISPDGGYESYAAGMKLGKDGFPLQKPRGPMAEGSRVVMCFACTGEGKTTTTVQGIVRADYCTTCQGEGAVVVGVDGKRLKEDGEEDAERTPARGHNVVPVNQIQVASELD